MSWNLWPVHNFSNYSTKYKISNPCIYFGSFAVKQYLEKFSLRILVDFRKAKLDFEYIFKQQKMYSFKYYISAWRFYCIELVAYV